MLVALADDDQMMWTAVPYLVYGLGIMLTIGVRNETTTLSMRPMLDKLASAIANGVVGWVAVAAGMVGNATAQTITSDGVATFKLWAFWFGLILYVLALIIYVWKVKISEKRHAEIVAELNAKLSAENENR